MLLNKKIANVRGLWYWDVDINSKYGKYIQPQLQMSVWLPMSFMHETYIYYLKTILKGFDHWWQACQSLWRRLFSSSLAQEGSVHRVLIWLITALIRSSYACSHFESTLTSGFLLILFQKKPSRLAIWAKIPIAHNQKLSKRKKKHLLNAETSLLLLTGNFFSFQGFIFSHEDPVCRFSCFAVNKCNSSHTMRINDVADDEVMAPAVF